MHNNVRREDPTVQHLLLGQMRSHTKHTRRLCKTKKLLISFCIQIKRFFNMGYTLTKLIFGWRANTAQSQLQQGLTVFVIRAGGEGLTTSFLFPFYGKCCADPLYLINWVVIFSLTRKQTQICSKTKSNEHWRYESANNAGSKLFTKAPILAPHSAILSQAVGNSKILLPKIIHEMSFIHDKFCSIRQSFVLLNGQFLWNKKNLVPAIDLFVKCEQIVFGSLFSLNLFL